MDNLMTRYNKKIATDLKNELNIKNVLSVPKLSKIVVNMGAKDALDDSKNLDKAIEALSLITGQRPKVTAARKSIATFKVREGDKMGVMVTLRGERMYAFFEKLVGIVLPRLRDFRGVPLESFDGRGNYTIGFSEHTVFSEIDPGKTDKIRGLEVIIVTTAKDNKEGKALLTALGMPFKKEVTKA